MTKRSKDDSRPVQLVAFLLTQIVWASLSTALRAEENVALSSALTIDQVQTGWQQLEDELNPIRIQWKRVQPHSLGWYNSECIDSDIELSPQQLTVGGDCFQYVGHRLELAYNPPEGLDVAGPVATYLPERKRYPFLNHLNARFQLPQPRIPLRLFDRRCDNSLLCDYWPGSPSEIPRVSYMFPEGESGAKNALLQIESHWNQRCASLEISGALLALRPLHCPIHSVDLTRCRIDQRQFNVRGVLCRRMIEQAEDNSYHRIWLLSETTPHQTMRYIGSASLEGTQVDIDWKADSTGNLQVTGWDYHLFRKDVRPTAYFGVAQVTDWSRQTPQPTPPIEESELPIGTWVDHQINQTQYLVKADRSQRLVTNMELNWLPTHAELLQSEEGQVEQLILRKIFWRRVWMGEFWWAITLLVLGVLVPVWLMIRKRRKWLERQ